MYWPTIVPFLGPAIGIVGLACAIVFYFLRKKDREPCYGVESITLIEGTSATIPNLKLIFENKECERVSVTRVFFWNAGRETIRKTDLVEVAPLVVELHATDIQVLSASVVYQNDDTSGFRVLRTDRGNDGQIKILFEFDFLDRFKGAVMQIVHTGAANVPITVSGRIIGSQPLDRLFKIENRFPNLGLPSGARSNKVAPWELLKFAVVFVIIFTGAIAWTDLLLPPRPEATERRLWLGLIFASMVAFIFAFLILRIARKRKIPLDLVEMGSPPSQL